MLQLHLKEYLYQNKKLYTRQILYYISSGLTDLTNFRRDFCAGNLTVIGTPNRTSVPSSNTDSYSHRKRHE